MKNSKGITLIALVITIIVLLILAGVSISLTLGNNGVLNQATNAVTKNKNASAKEDVEMAWAGAVSSYWAELASDSSKQMDKTFLTPKLVGKTSNGEINSVDDNGDGTYIVYYTANGETEQQSFLMDEQGRASKLSMPNTTDLRSMYGTEVSGYTGYTAIDVTEWKLFYVDEDNKEVFLISSNTVANTGTIVKLASETGISYSGPQDVDSLEYGHKYNGLWLNKCLPNNINSSYINLYKQVAYMCDPVNWERYKGNKAKYAVGGVTAEMFSASFYKVQVNDFKQEGYSGSGNRVISKCSREGYWEFMGDMYSSPLRNKGFYSDTPHYFLASPGANQYMAAIYQNYFANGSTVDNTNFGFRPAVCLPLYALEIVENGGTKTLKIAD